jgi:1-acyl-sn-glycerol-3-phosphate acyltransferase
MQTSGVLAGLTQSVAERVDRLELPWNRYGVDPYGISKKHLVIGMSFFTFLYRHYFGVKVRGIENVPRRGRAMLVGNHSGGVALDGAMTIASMFLEMEPPRLAQGMVEKFIAKIPLASLMANRTGQFTGLPEHAVRLLEDDRLLMVFPEGARGTAKLYKDRYSLVDFGTGFMRLALKTHSPIIPFAFLGGGDAVPTIMNLYTLGKLFGVPYIPVTPYLVALPLPVKLEIVFGEPIYLSGTGNEDDEVVAEYVFEVKTQISEMLERARKEREGLVLRGRS